MTELKGVRLSWTRWSLARQIPLLTAAIVTIVVAFTLTVTYRALVETRAESLHTRMSGVMHTLTTATATATKARVTLLRSVAGDSSVLRALARGPAVPADSAVLRGLARLAVPADSGLPVELWNTEGNRIAVVGKDVRGDSVSRLAPELRSARGTRVSEVPIGSTGADSAQFGSLYASNGRVLFWTVVPVLENGKRAGYIVQQRRVIANPTIRQTLFDMSGEELSLYFRNTTDDFASSLDGTPIPRTTSRDSTPGGYVVKREGLPPRVGVEGRSVGGPYIFSLEAPRSSLVDAPRSTIRKIGLLCLVALLVGFVLSTALSRRIVRPLGQLVTMSEGIARGDYSSRVESDEGSANEVARLASTFNRMASEVEASQDELQSQVEEALTVSEQLESANTQLQETSVEAEEARDAAVEANRAKSDFLAVMSHELRTPLNAIGGYAEILQLGIYGELTKQQNDALVRIARSQQALLSLINDVLNFAKLEAGQVHYEISDVPIRGSMQVLEELIAPQLRDRNINYSVHPCDARMTVRADPDKLQQILLNLLSNAIKYSHQNGSIELRCDMVGDRVVMRVRDTGVGIAADRIGKIFDPFIQVGRALNRPHDGVGLGLSISRDLATGMNGSLTVESEVGVGSAFILSLPRGADRA